MSRSDVLRRLYMRVHPDLHVRDSTAQRVNEASFKSLQALLAGQQTPASVLSFFVSSDDSPRLRRVEARVRPTTLDADLRELSRRCEGYDPAEQPHDATSVASSPSDSYPWWRMRRGQRRAAASLDALLARHATEARDLAAAAEIVRTELAAELLRLRDAYGLAVRFEGGMRCALTKRRMAMTLSTLLEAHEPVRCALGGRSVRFTNGEPGPAAARTAAEAAAGGSVWLSSQDTPGGWRRAVCGEDEVAPRGGIALDAATALAASRARESAAYAAQHASRRPMVEASAAVGAAAWHADGGGGGGGGGGVGAVEAEREAALSLGLRSLRPQARALRSSGGYLSWLASLADAATQMRGGGWLGSGAAAAGWRGEIVAGAPIRALRSPSLLPRRRVLRLPLECDPPSLLRMLDSEGVEVVAEEARARALLGECAAALGLREIRCDETLAPAQVSSACEGLLGRVDELATRCEGTVLLLGEAYRGFGMGDDGALRCPWDATAT